MKRITWIVLSCAFRCVAAQFAREGELLLEPTFCCCSAEFGSRLPREGLKLEWRPHGRDDCEWLALPECEWKHRPVSHTYRASIRYLDEDTEYEVRLAARGQVVATGAFRTWKSDVHIAKTIELPLDGEGAIAAQKISDKGTPDGWIRYTSAPDAMLDFGEGDDDAIVVDGAEYVVFDGMCIRGSRGRRVFKLTNCRHVRIRNCDISRWGRVGIPRFDLCGRIYAPGMSDMEYGINFDAAIEIGEGCFGVVVEGCYVHDPRGRANSWYYSHPAGPEAVTLCGVEGSTVIRWNNFVGSDAHRFNDAVEGAGNFRDDGGFNRTADIYGNFMAFCNDDCVEMDGGQRNLRNFGNRYEAALCGVSVQGCMVGPAYVYRNLFSGMCGEFGEWGQTVKTGGGRHGPEAEIFLEDNVFWGDGYGVEMRTNLVVRSRRNVFAGNQRINQRRVSPLSSSEGDAKKMIGEDELDPAFPLRPASLVLDKVRFSGFKVKNGVCEPSSVAVRAKDVGGRGCRFKVEKNADFDWLVVVPREGTVPVGGEAALDVSVDTSKMRGRRWYRGAFLVKEEGGLSRPFTVYAETDFVPPYRVEDSGARTVYLDGFREGEHSAVPAEKEICCEFSVPEDGRYYVMAHGVSEGDIMAAVDDDALEKSHQQGQPYPTWTMVAAGRRQGNMCRYYDLAKGRHTLRLKGCGDAFRCDGIVVTDNPLVFEPRTLPVPGPAEVSRRIAGQFLSTEPDAYQPQGMTRHSYVYGSHEHVHYATVSLWVNALECARLSGDADTERRLVEAYRKMVREKPYVFHGVKHVDYEVTGALPLEIAILTGDKDAGSRGMWYADRQWEKPTAEDNNLKQVQPLEKRMEWWNAGYTSETRLWLDDMYMISLLQLNAYRYTGERKYLDRTAREMALYLERLPRRSSLYFHAPDAPYAWARGNGWMAAAMAMVLKELDESHPCRAKILAEYRAMMAVLLRLQRRSGLWGQLVDDAESWDETSGSAMFAYAMAEGVRKGWLTAPEFAAARDRAYAALVSRLDEHGNLSDVCIGTGARNDREWYMNRGRINGDPHGQAPLLWLCRAMLESSAEESSKSRSDEKGTLQCN